MFLSCPCLSQHDCLLDWCTTANICSQHKHIYWVYKTLGTLLPSEQPQFVRAWTGRFYRDAGPCWLQCFPQLCQVSWMSFGWWTILDSHGKLLSLKNPAALQFLTHSNQCTRHLLPIPIQRHLNLVSCPFTPLNGTHTQSMSHLSQSFKILL